MEKLFLDVEVREELGKSGVKGLRRLDFIPAVVYKRGGKTAAIKVPKREFIKILHTKAGENVLVTLRIIKDKEGKPASKTVLIKEIQLDPVRDDIIHVDFNEISLTEKIKIKVPVSTKGEAVGVKRDGGVLEHILWELEVECLPTQIPEKLEIDVTALEIGKDIFVKEISAPEGVRILSDPQAIVVSVKASKEEVIPTPEEAGMAPEEPEVIREKKPEAEEEAEEEATKESPKGKEKEKKE